MLEFSIATITVFVGFLNELVKYISKKCFNVEINKYIPLFSIGFGMILGICGYFIPNVTMGNNIIEAIFIGISAGCAATGIHQVGKQLQPEKLEVEYVDEDIVDEETYGHQMTLDEIETPPTEDVDDYNEDE
jgi:hypothetical protein